MVLLFRKLVGYICIIVERSMRGSKIFVLLEKGINMFFKCLYVNMMSMYVIYIFFLRKRKLELELFFIENIFNKVNVDER